MVNAIKVAADFIDRLPQRPAVAGDDRRATRDSSIPTWSTPSVDQTSVKLLIRDFDDRRPRRRRKRWLEALAREAVAAWPGASVEIAGRGVLSQHARGARPASRRRRVRARGDPARRARPSASAPIRGGTDGSRLSFMGLPTPNIFAGEQNFHSRLEWVSVQDMEKAVEVIVQLARVWEERA